MSRYGEPIVADRPRTDVFARHHRNDITSTPPHSAEINSIHTSSQKQSLYGVPAKTTWSTGTKVILGLIIGAVTIGIIAGVIVAVLLTRSSAAATTTTTPNTINSTYISVSWSFDNITADQYGVYNGQLINNAGYSAISTTMPYVGQGQALSVTATSNQYFQVTTFLNLTYTSFTIEAWIYSTVTYTGDNGLIGQCQCSSCSNQCFYFIVRSGHLYAGFTLNDLIGIQTLSANTWYHVAFVYNYATQQQILYLNGVQDNIQSNAAPYQGTNATITIGSTQLSLTTNFFTGYIDNLRIVTRAKSATEILSDASLIAYYSFDLPTPTMDNGPNGLNGSSINTTTVTGLVNQGMQFNGSLSYFQVYGFYQMGWGVKNNQPFSIALWIHPSAITSCVFIQQSLQSVNGTCINQLGITTTYGQTGQLVVQGYAWPTIYGPYLTINTWVHVGWTFSVANGYRLYVNGIYYGTTGAFSQSGSGSITWLQVGYHFTCTSAYISNGAYLGIIDELYLYNRELAYAEVTALANP